MHYETLPSHNAPEAERQPAALIVPIIDPAQHREGITLNHELANPA